MRHSIYPESFIKTCGVSPELLTQLPSKKDIAKLDTMHAGIGIFALRGFHRGEKIGKFIATIEDDVKQHTLQRSPDVHVYDPYFVGFLLHSCSPNCVLDMHEQDVFCIQDITKGAPLTMDYASTEDVLFRQFACCCGSPNCREWITGRAEPVNAEGRFYLEEKHAARRDYRTAREATLDAVQ